MMLVNFCYSELMKNVSSDVVSSEGFESTNLLSRNLNVRKKGFLAERFVKPPVVLSFVFVCEVNINHIVILTSVGSQKTIGIEVFTESSDSLVQSVSSGVLKHSENGFVFYKYGDKMKHVLSDHYKTLSFHTFKSSRFLKTNVVKVKIFRTINSTVPALGKIEIWGYPSRNCPQNILDNVYKTWNKIQHEHNYINKSSISFNNRPVESNAKPDLPISNCNNEHIAKPNFSSVSKNNEYSLLQLSSAVPEEFIDPITCEIMVLPIILPCGKIIDSITLEKHSEAESKWGRTASDPFTGKLLTENHKTMFASDLKLRIDKFLCDHSNEAAFKSLPRTVGRKFINNRPTETSVIKKSCLDLPGVRSSENNFQTTLNFQDVESNVYESIRSKKCKQKELTSGISLNQSKSSQKATNFIANLNSYVKVPNYNSVHSSNLHGTQVTSMTNVSDSKQTLILSHEEKSEFALEHSLKLTLSSLPSYSSTKVSSINNTECKKCFFKDNLFQLPCCHFLCRTCLLSVIESKCLKCVVCQTEFKTSDPQRFHL